MAALMDAKALRSHLAEKIPALWTACEEIATEWSSQIVSNLETLSSERIAFPKTFTDPVLGPIELFEWEVAILDSPLLQRLRGVRQLGMAHAVYTGATHDRLGHTLGVVEVANRMINALLKNARYHQEFGSDPDPDVPLPDDDDRHTIRLAALFHDTGHGPFSHASEPLIERAHANDFTLLRNILQQQFVGAGNVKTSEAVAVLLVLSEPLRKIFEHPRFRAPITNREELPIGIVARLLGSWRGLRAGYLAGVICGPIDADKLDYMARDSYFTGLPLGLDVERLINKLEVITIKPERVADPVLKERATAAPNQRLYELGISVAGLTAYEQMIIGRVLLYDRVYFHHKVRSAEAMVRLLFRVVERERKTSFTLRELLSDINDDSMTYLLSGEMNLGEMTGGVQESREVGGRIRVRRFYHRAFAFAERFLAGLEDFAPQDATDTRSMLWQHVLDALGSEDALEAFAEEIFDLSQRLHDAIPEIGSLPKLQRYEVIVDMTEDRVVASSRGVFMRTEGGELNYANLFFNPDKWSDAYKTQKKCGYVFAPRQAAKLVALATQILLFQKFGVLMGPQARHLCKLEFVPMADWSDWLAKARDKQLCSPETLLALTEEKPLLVQFRARDFKIPDGWLELQANLKSRLADEFQVAFAGGFVASVHEAVISGIEHICYAMEALEKTGEFVKSERPDEKRRLQNEILKALNARGCAAIEGTEVSGGETDLILPGNLIVENKVAGLTTDLQSLKPDAPWQARRYALAFNRRVFFVIIAYRPAAESKFLSLPERVSVLPLLESPEESVYVRFLIPWGTDTPSKAKTPA